MVYKLVGMELVFDMVVNMVNKLVGNMVMKLVGWNLVVDMVVVDYMMQG